MKDLFATQYEQSVQRLEAGDYAEAIPALCDLAEKGYDRAQYMLGVCYREGMGVEKSMERAMIYIFDAAVQGLAEAQYEMGEMHGEDFDRKSHEEAWEIINGQINEYKKR